MRFRWKDLFIFHKVELFRMVWDSSNSNDDTWAFEKYFWEINLTATDVFSTLRGTSAKQTRFIRDTFVPRILFLGIMELTEWTTRSKFYKKPVYGGHIFTIRIENFVLEKPHIPDGTKKLFWCKDVLQLLCQSINSIFVKIQVYKYSFTE